MERAGGNEQNVVCFDESPARADRSAFHNRKHVALHAFAGNIWTVPLPASCDFVNFVDEKNAEVFGGLNGLACDGVLIDQLLRFFGFDDSARVAYIHFAAARA